MLYYKKLCISLSFSKVTLKGLEKDEGGSAVAEGYGGTRQGEKKITFPSKVFSSPPAANHFYNKKGVFYGKIPAYYGACG